MMGAKARRRYRSVPSLQLIELPEGASMEAALKAYRDNPDVLYAEPDYRQSAYDTVPNDVSFTRQWGLRNTGQTGGTAGADIRATQAWDLSIGSNQVGVVVIDSGVDYTHPDLVPNLHQNTADCDNDGTDDDGDGFTDNCWGANAIWQSGNANDENGHGTHVAGIIGASGNNAVQVAGVNWRVDIFPCRFLDSSGHGWTSDAIECLDWAARLKDRGFNIVATNNSWGGGGYSQALYEAIEANRERGILFFSAAGNGDENHIGFDIDTIPDYPSSFPLDNIVSVAASDSSDRLATFSNFGSHSVHLAAPGVGVLSSMRGGGTALMDGTSMATPFATGTAALLKAQNPALTWTQIRNRIIAGGDDVSALGKTVTGRRLNAYGAMTCANRTVQRRLQPVTQQVTAAIGDPVHLRYLNINCDAPNGSIDVTLNPGAQVLTLQDDGQGGDQVPGDGIYSLDWTSPTTGTFTFTLPGNDTVTAHVIRPYSFWETPYQWRTISGTSLNLGDDSNNTINSPFPISFGGVQFNKLYVSSNGIISLDRAFTAGFYSPLPTSDAGVLIAPLWNDFLAQVDTSHNVYWGTTGSAPNRELVVEWRSLGFAGPTPDLTHTVTFQAVFFENSSDVLFNYADPQFYDDYVSAAPGVIGIQVSSSEATVFSAGSSGPILRPNTAILWKAQPNFSFSLDSTFVRAFAGEKKTYTGMATAYGGWKTPVTISCAGTEAPSDCAAVTVVPTPKGAPFGLSVSDTRTRRLEFTIEAAGTATGLTKLSRGATLSVSDFEISAPEPNVIGAVHGEQTPSASFILESKGEFNNVVYTSCAGLPPGATCNVPASYLGTDERATRDMRVSTSAITPIGTYPITLKAYLSGNIQTKTQPFTLVVKPDFTLSASGNLIGGKPSDVKAAPVTITADPEYAGTINLSCSIAPSDSATCQMQPATVSTFPATVNMVATGGQKGHSYQVQITGTDGTTTRTAWVTYQLDDYRIIFLGLYARPGTSQSTSLSYEPIALFRNYGVVHSTCDVSSLGPSASCSIQESVPLTKFMTVPLTVSVPAGTAAGAYPVTVRSHDETGEYVHDATAQLLVVDYSISAGAAREKTVAIGFYSDPFDMIITAPPQNITLFYSCSPLPGQNTSCSFEPYNWVSLANGSVNKTFKVNPLSTAIPGDYTFGISASVAGSPDQFPDIYTIHIRDWKLVTDETVVLSAGGSKQITVAPDSWAGITSPLDLSCPNLSAGISCSFSPSTISSGVTVLTLNAASNATPGLRSIKIRATANNKWGSFTKEVALALTVEGPKDFAISMSPLTSTVPAGATSQHTITLTGNQSFSSAVTFSCSGLPAQSTCSFSPQSLTPGPDPVVTTLTVRTTARSAAALHNSKLVFAFALLLPAIVLAPFGTRHVRTKARTMFLLLSSIASLAMIMSCGGGGGTGGGTYNPPPPSGTPSGTYTITVTASGGSVQHATTFTLVVQ